MANTNTIPDPYRDNEANVKNFADHIREKAALEQISVRDMASREISRFRDVTFWVNTQYGGSQLRLRDSDGKVISKLKKGAKINILNSSVALDSPDNDRGQWPDDSHIFVLVEANAADTEAGGKEGEKVQGWVSTEYIQQLGEPEPIPVPEPIPQLIVPIAPLEEKPEEWVYPEAEEEKVIPEPPKPRPDILKPIPEETEKPNSVQAPDKKYVEVPTPPVVPVAPEKSESETREKPNTVQAPDKQYQPVPVPTNTPNTQPTNETEKPNSVQIGTEKPVVEKKKWLFEKFIDANVALYNWVTGDKGIVSKQSTTTTKSGELEVKPTENTNTEIKKEEKGSINIAK